MTNVTVSALIEKIKTYEFCDGVSNDEVSPELIYHVIPCETNLNFTSSPIQAKQYKRPRSCLVLHVVKNSTCSKCQSFKLLSEKYKRLKGKIINTPAKPNAPLSKTHPNRVKLALQQERTKCKLLESQIERMKNEISSKGEELDEDLRSDINDIMNANLENITPFMKLFWKEQQKAASQNPCSVKYHPMIIRFCLSLASKSASTYDELRDSKVLTLPSRRTLRDYKNAIRPCVGFNPGVIEELKKTTAKLEGYQRYIVISFDEIKIRENLVFDKHYNELIGYVDIGDPELNFSTFKDSDDLATHCLVYYIRGVASGLKFCFAYFATKGVTATQIMPTFWKSVSILELECNLFVIAAVSDGASPNRSFYRMHKDMDNSESEVVYRTINVFAQDRYIYFFADAPHLMKTLRNCIYHSGDGKCTRSLWNRDQIIVWYHFVKLVYDELNNDIKLLPKLTLEHVKLNPFSVMNVRLATQILSQSVANILYTYYPRETHATAELCEFMDKFFDCANTRNQTEGIRKRKDFLQPYRSPDDIRFDWLKNTFLGYFNNWRENIENRDGNFTRNARDRMFISWQTFEGLQITVNSLIEATKYLLQNGMSFVLTERFNQDVLEEYFGRQRSLGRRNDNPTLIQFGYQSNTLRMQRSVVPATGNTRGANVRKCKVSWSKVDEEPLNKRAKCSSLNI